MRPRRPRRPRLAGLFFAAALCLAATARPAAAGERIFLNSFGSTWGLWARCYCVIHDDAVRHRLEIEELSLEPNRNDRQGFEIAGFRLAYYYLDKETDAYLPGAGASGPALDHALSLPPGTHGTTKDLFVEVPRGDPPGEGETLVVELQIITRGKAYFGLVVGEFEGGPP